MPLLIFVGLTGRNTSFYASFVFLPGESKEDYLWAFQRLKEVYQSIRLPAPQVISTDKGSGIVPAVSEGLPRPTTSHVLYTWHMNKNILANTRGDFTTQEGYEEFFKG